jgi:hypothetical protein
LVCRQKVDEAPTPYRYLSESEASESGREEEEDDKAATTAAAGRLGQNVLADAWNAVHAKLLDLSAERPPSIALPAAEESVGTIETANEQHTPVSVRHNHNASNHHNHHNNHHHNHNNCSSGGSATAACQATAAVTDTTPTATSGGTTTAVTGITGAAATSSTTGTVHSNGDRLSVPRARLPALPANALSMASFDSACAASAAAAAERLEQECHDVGYTDFGLVVPTRSPRLRVSEKSFSGLVDRDCKDREKDKERHAARRVGCFAAERRNSRDAEGAGDSTGFFFGQDKEKDKDREKEREKRKDMFAGLNSGTGGGDGDGDGDGLEKGERKQFLQRRAGHYNEFKMVQAMRKQMEDEDEDD